MTFMGYNINIWEVDFMNRRRRFKEMLFYLLIVLTSTIIIYALESLEMTPTFSYAVGIVYMMIIVTIVIEDVL